MNIINICRTGGVGGGGFLHLLLKSGMDLVPTYIMHEIPHTLRKWSMCNICPFWHSWDILPRLGTLQTVLLFMISQCFYCSRVTAKEVGVLQISALWGRVEGCLFQDCPVPRTLPDTTCQGRKICSFFFLFFIFLVIPNGYLMGIMKRKMNGKKTWASFIFWNTLAPNCYRL
jgi:hypothetical protein